MVPVTLTLLSPVTDVTGLQWSIDLSAVLDSIVMTDGAAAVAATKVVECNFTITPAVCLAVGLNENVWPPGVVAVYEGIVKAGLLPGDYAIDLSNLLAASITAQKLTLVGLSGIFTIEASPCDLTLDGIIDSNDWQETKQQAKKRNPCTNGDVNEDGDCNVQDVAIVRRAIRQGSCIVN